VNGNMFTGLHQENMMLRLSEKDRAELLAVKGAAPFEPMPGRAMKEYVVVPQTMLKKPAELKQWLARSFAYASSLPPKAKKK
jgi:TfoX/Sxy family transcriptional regulator of competence genes